MAQTIEYEGNVYVVRTVRTFATMARARYSGGASEHVFRGSAGFGRTILSAQRRRVFMFEYAAQTDTGADEYKDAIETLVPFLRPGTEHILGSIWGLSMYKLDESVCPNEQRFHALCTWVFDAPVYIPLEATRRRGRWVHFDDAYVLSQLEQQVSKSSHDELRYVYRTPPADVHAEVPGVICSVHACTTRSTEHRVYHQITHPVCSRHRTCEPLLLSHAAATRHREALDTLFKSGQVHLLSTYANGPVRPWTFTMQRVKQRPYLVLPDGCLEEIVGIASPYMWSENGYVYQADRLPLLEYLKQQFDL